MLCARAPLTVVSLEGFVSGNILQTRGSSSSSRAYCGRSTFVRQSTPRAARSPPIRMRSLTVGQSCVYIRLAFVYR